MLRPARLAALGVALVLACLSQPARAGGPLTPTTVAQIHDFAKSAFDELGIPGAAVVVVDAEGTV